MVRRTSLLTWVIVSTRVFRSFPLLIVISVIF
ncbi:hypothetical protein LINPERHAP2_LOCUS15945 [Linum perenne]